MRKVIFSILVLAFAACKPSDDNPQNLEVDYFEGLWVANEGTYTWGNASLSVLPMDSSDMLQAVFAEVNERPLGDVLQSVSHNWFGHSLLVVNNSGKIEIVDNKTMESVATISGLNSPRYLQVIDHDKAYCTDLYANAVYVLDLNELNIEKTIQMNGWTEAILNRGSEIYVLGMESNMLYRINRYSDIIEDSLALPREPESMEIATDGYLWVLCSGGLNAPQEPAIVKVDLDTWLIESQFDMVGGQDYPGNLVFNGNQDSFYFINDGDIWESSIWLVNPVKLLDGGGRNLYTLFMDPFNEVLWVGDARDFISNGFVHRILPDAPAWQDSMEVGVGPGHISIPHL